MVSALTTAKHNEKAGKDARGTGVSHQTGDGIYLRVAQRLGDLRPTARGLLEGCCHEGRSGGGHGAFRDDFVNRGKAAEPVRFEELSAWIGAPSLVHLFRRAKDHG